MHEPALGSPARRTAATHTRTPTPEGPCVALSSLLTSFAVDLDSHQEPLVTHHCLLMTLATPLSSSSVMRSILGNHPGDPEALDKQGVIVVLVVVHRFRCCDTGVQPVELFCSMLQVRHGGVLLPLGPMPTADA